MPKSDFLNYLLVLDFACVPGDHRLRKVSLNCSPSFYALYHGLIKMLAISQSQMQQVFHRNLYSIFI